MKTLLVLLGITTPVVCTVQSPRECSCPAPIEPTCGDGVVTAPEECEPGTFDGWCSNYIGLVDGIMTCADDCRIDYSQCLIAPQ